MISIIILYASYVQILIISQVYTGFKVIFILIPIFIVIVVVFVGVFIVFVCAVIVFVGVVI